METAIEELKKIWPEIEVLIMDDQPNLNVWTSEGDYKTIKEVIRERLTLPYKINVTINPDILKKERLKY